MALESVLIALIKHLDKVERAFVRKYLGGEELQLFSILTQKKVIDSAKMRAAFPQLSDPAYATLRSRLQDRLAEAIGEFRRRKLPEAQVQTLVHAADALMNKGHALHAQRMLAKAARLAIHLYDHGSLPRMQALRARLPLFLKGDKVAATKWPAIDQLLAQIVDGHRHEQACRIWMQTALDIKAGSAEDLVKRILQLSAELPTLDLRIQSKANLFLGRAHWICRRFGGKLDECESLVDWAIDLSRQQSWLWEDFEGYDVFERAYYSKAIFLSGRDDFAASIQLLDNFAAFSNASMRTLMPDWNDIKNLVRVRQLIHGGDSRIIRRGLKSMLSELDKPNAISDNRYSLYMRVIEYCLHTKEFELARPWLAMLKEAKTESKRASKVISSFLVELAFWFAKQDFDELDNCIRRLTYFAKSRQADLGFVGVVTAGFNSINGASPDVRQRLNGFIAAMGGVRAEKGNEIYFERFDLQAYLMTIRSTME